MKKYLPFLLISLLASLPGLAQMDLAPNQNPNFSESRARYMSLADSLLAAQGTTIQDTYKAIDWMVDRAEARALRRDFRRQIRLIRAEDYRDFYYPRYNRLSWRRNIYPSWSRNSLWINPFRSFCW